MSPEDKLHSERQREWARWAAHGYSKRYQPRSMLRFGLVFTVLFGALIVAVFVLAAHGRLP